MKTTRNQPLRWSVEKAAKEFGIDRRTLTKNLTAAGISAGDDSRWTTQDMVRAIYGDKDAAELRLTVAKAEALERKNRVADGELVSVDAVLRFNERICAALRETVMALDVPKEAKEQMLTELRKLDDEHAQREGLRQDQDEDAEDVDPAAGSDGEPVGG